MISVKTILVTGCAGFIGSNFVEQFKIKYPKTEIIGIDDFSTGKIENLDTTITFYKGSVVDEKLLDQIFEKHLPQYVFHFAALPRVSYSVENPHRTTKANTLGTVALLEASRQYNVKRFIFSSSSSVYGGAQILPTKESDNLPDPKSPYAAQKYAGEIFCKVFSNVHGLETVCLRYFNVFGPGQRGDSPYSTVIAAWFESIYFPEKIKAFIEGDGTASRDFCHVDIAVYSNILAMESNKIHKGDIYNVANGIPITINEVKGLVEKITGIDLTLEKRDQRPGDVKHTHADLSKIYEELGTLPIINFEEALKNISNWFEKEFIKQFKHEELTAKEIEPLILKEIEGAVRSFNLKKNEVRILDYGCGIGKSVEKLKSLGYINTYGVDISERKIKQGLVYLKIKGHNHREALQPITNNRTNFPDKFFHFIFSEQVFEHVEKPEEVVQEISRISKKGGLGLHIFPGSKEILESHVFMPFVHWLPKNKTRYFIIGFFVLCKKLPPNWLEMNKEKFSEKVKKIYEYLDTQTYYRHHENMIKNFTQNNINARKLITGKEKTILEMLTTEMKPVRIVTKKIR